MMHCEACLAGVSRECETSRIMCYVQNVCCAVRGIHCRTGLSTLTASLSVPNHIDPISFSIDSTWIPIIKAVHMHAKRVTPVESGRRRPSLHIPAQAPASPYAHGPPSIRRSVRVLYGHENGFHFFRKLWHCCTQTRANIADDRLHVVHGELSSQFTPCKYALVPTYV